MPSGSSGVFPQPSLSDNPYWEEQARKRRRISFTCTCDLLLCLFGFLTTTSQTANNPDNNNLDNLDDNNLDNLGLQQQQQPGQQQPYRLLLSHPIAHLQNASFPIDYRDMYPFWV